MIFLSLTVPDITSILHALLQLFLRRYSAAITFTDNIVTTLSTDTVKKLIIFLIELPTFFFENEIYT